MLKATNYDAGIMYTSLGFITSLLHVLAVSNSTSSMSTVCRVWEIWPHRITNAYVPKPTHGLAVPNLVWMSRYFNTSLKVPILAVSYGTSSMT